MPGYLTKSEFIPSKAPYRRTDGNVLYQVTRRLLKAANKKPTARARKIVDTYAQGLPSAISGRRTPFGWASSIIRNGTLYPKPVTAKTTKKTNPTI